MKKTLIILMVAMAFASAGSARADDIANADTLKKIKDVYDNSTVFSQLGTLVEMLKFCGFGYKSDKLENFAQSKIPEMARAFDAKNSDAWDSLETRRDLRTAYMAFAMGMKEGAAAEARAAIEQMNVKQTGKTAVCGDANDQYQSFVVRFGLLNTTPTPTPQP